MNDMGLIKLLLYGNLIFNYAIVDSEGTESTSRNQMDNDTINTAVNFRLPYYIVPKQYDVELVLDTEQDTFHGVCNVSIIIYNVITSNIKFHSMNLNIIQCTLSQRDNISAEIYRPHHISYIHDLQIVILNFPHLIYPGNYILSITFTSVISNDVGGFVKIPYINTKKNKKWLIATDNSATGIRRLFPCWDEPRIKAKFNISIKHFKHYNAFSNAAPIYTLHKHLNITVTHFGITPEIPTYRVAIVLFDTIDYFNISFKKTSNKKLWGRKQLEEDHMFAFKLINNVTSIVQQQWQLEKKSLLDDHYVIPGLQNDDLDKLNFIFHREKDIIYNEKIHSIAHQIELSRLIGRKVVGQLFGIEGCSLWWSYMWLNEGIATLFGIYIIDQVLPDFQMLELFVVQTQFESLHLDDSQVMNPFESEINNISEINSLFSFAYYIKAPSILRMLQHIVGDEIFRDGIAIYLKRQLGSLNDFWDDIQLVYDSQLTKLQKPDIKDIMDPFIKEKQYPVLRTQNFYNEGYFKWITIFTKSSLNWVIPLTYTTPSYNDFKKTVPSHYLDLLEEFNRIEFNGSEKEWIIFNLQQTGYYRVNYDLGNWLRIENYLNSDDNYKNIHVLNRAQIIDDAFYFVTSGELHPSVLWKLVKYLQKDNKYVAWYPMFKIIERLSFIIPYREIIHFKETILELLTALLHKIGYIENDDDDPHIKCLRQEAAKWACSLGDSKCKEEALHNLEWHLTNQTHNKLLPWWTKWTYCNGLSISHIPFGNVFNNLDKMLEIENPQIMEILACSNNISDILFIYFQLQIKRICTYNCGKNVQTNFIIKNQISLFYYFLQKHKNDDLFACLLENWYQFKPKEIGITASLVIMINSVYSLSIIKQYYNYKICRIIIIRFFYSIQTVLAVYKQCIEEWTDKNLIDPLLSHAQNKLHMRSSEIEKHILVYVTKYS
ncbi:hypothetical protein P5V15_007480 [Pogonomyrmex californicus]